MNDFKNYRDARDRRKGEIMIDLGVVSEDAVWDPLTPPEPPNGTLDTEDRNNLGGQVDYDKDLGLDGVADDKETAQPEKQRFAASSPAQDPAGDDRYPTTINTNLPERTTKDRLAKYLGINGTERNQQTDTEDLNKDGILQKTNNYVEYQIDLAAPAFTDLGRDYQDDSRFTRAGNGWRLYRIPLSDVYNQVGTVDFTAVQHMRVWFRGVGDQPSGDPDTLDIQIAGIEVVGNRWQVAPSTELASDELFNVAVVNNKENSNYQPPFGIQRVNSVQEREQSISLEYENFRDGNELQAYRPVQTSSDYTLYQVVAYYVSPQFESPDDSVEFYLRFGSNASTDTLSYYEISTTLTRDDPRLRADHWLDLRFKLTDLSRLKLNAPPGTPADSFLVGGPPSAPPPPGGYGGGGHDKFIRTGASESVHSAPADIGNGLYVTVRGLPSFSRVRRLSVGLRNKSGHEIPKGTVWFDELRMGAVRKEAGVAGRAAVNVTLADLASLQATVSTTSADFLRLGQTRGSGTTQLSYNFGTQVNLNKFADPLRLRAPLRFNYKRDRQTPKFIPNSDVEFKGGGSGRDITEQGQKDVSLTLGRDPQGYSPALVHYTLDAMNLGGSASSSYNLGVTQVDSTKRVNGNFSYSPGISQIHPLRVFNRVSVRPWPTSFNLGLAGGTSEQFHYSRDERNPEMLSLANQSKSRTGILTLSTGFQPLGGLLGWSWNSTRDLIDDHFGPDSSIVRLQRPQGSFFGLNTGRETHQSQSTNFNYTPPLMGALRPRFAWSSNYNRNSDPNLTRADFDSTVIELSNGNNANLVLTLPLGHAVKKLLGSSSETQTLPRPPAASQNRQGRGAPPPPGGVTAPADTAHGGEPEKPKGPGTGDRLRSLFTRYIVLSDIQTSATFGRRSSYTGIHGDAPLAYRLGLTRDVGLGSSVQPVGRAPFNQTFGETQTYRGNGNVKLLSKVTLDFSFQKQKDMNRTNNGVGRVEDNTTWPEIRFNWGDIHKRLPLIRTIFTDFRTVSTTFSRQTRKSGTDLNPNESISITRNWRPLVSIQGTLKGNWRTSFAANRSSTTTESQREGSAGLTSDQTTVSYNLTLGKRFTRGGPGSGKDIDLTVDGTYSKQSNATRSTSGISPNDRSTDNLQLRLNTSLKFTRTMSGTFGLNFAQNRDLTKHWTQRSLGISFTTGFNF